MSRFEKVLKKISRRPRTFKYSELKILLEGLGYEEIKTGRTSGSRVAYYNSRTDHMIRLHRPHPGDELKHYLIVQIYENLKKQGVSV